jgi:CelD/BcsL family acetyltransferase involved in cellulose biosynthesis
MAGQRLTYAEKCKSKVHESEPMTSGLTEHSPKNPQTVISFFQRDGEATTGAIPHHSPIDFIKIRRGLQRSSLNFVGLADRLNLTPFQRSSWLCAWDDAIGQQGGYEPVVVLCYKGAQLVLVLPLAIVKRSGVRCLTWSAYQQSDYCAPIVNTIFKDAIGELDGEQLMREIAGRIGGIDLIYFPKQPRLIGDVSNPFVLPKALPHHAGAHCITFNPGEDWETDQARRRSSKTRRRLREKRSALEKSGPVTFRVAASEPEALELIEACLEAKSGQLRELGHWDPFSPPGVRKFLTCYFSGNVAGSTWAVSLDVAGQPAATAFGFRGDKEWLLYQMAMLDGPERRHSPGSHLLMELMRHCIGIGVQRLDLALGDESYKSEWCDEHIDLRMSAVALTSRGALLRKIILLRAGVRLRLASNPRFYKCAKWLKGMTRKLKLPF